jgi:hypothetical protein
MIIELVDVNSDLFHSCVCFGHAGALIYNPALYTLNICCNLIYRCSGFVHVTGKLYPDIG